MRVNAVVVDPRDNVAVVIEEVKKGETLYGVMGDGLAVSEDIPGNHKVALEEIPKGSPVIKYGFKIGVAKESIQPGQWVHTHNLQPEGK